MASTVESYPQRPPEERVIGGRFRLVRELGVGGMGTVYEAEDRQTGARVALKLMRRELVDDPRAVERFRREGAALAAVRHPTIVQVREVGQLDGALYLAMELLEGETLGERLSRVGRMSPQELLPVVLGLCDGLRAAHAGGIIHRDIKPSNIHLPDPEVLARAQRTHERAPVKLVDFGVARVRGFDRMTSSGLAVGTVRYMAPEQLSGGAVDERADVYALGVVLYEALAGEHPFERSAGDDPIGAILVGRSTPLSSLRPELPAAVAQVVHRAMARLPHQRFPSARALAEAFRQAVLDPARAPAGDATRPARPVSEPPAFAATELAVPASTPQARGTAPSESMVRRRKRPRAAPVWLLLPLLVGACLIPGLGLAGFAGCGSWMTDFQVRVALENVRATVDARPERFAHHRETLDRLEALHREDRINLFAAAAFNARVQESMRANGRVEPEDVDGVMVVARDILARGGEYDLDHYSEMAGSQRSSTPAAAPVSSVP